MNFSEKVAAARETNNSLLCVGLDPDPNKMPKRIAEGTQSLYVFCRDIVDATADQVCAFKPNSAFFEKYGSKGEDQLVRLVDYIKREHPLIPVIFDAKRGDIANTNDGYVINGFNIVKADAITLNPYLGGTALQPFFDQADRGAIVLCRTSNDNSNEFQGLVADGKPVYQHVAERMANVHNTNKNIALVMGATNPNEIAEVRQIVGPDMLFLLPGIGAQGGDVEATVRNSGDASIINSSRGIIFASGGDDFAEAARQAAIATRDDINKYRN